MNEELILFNHESSITTVLKITTSADKTLDENGDGNVDEAGDHDEDSDDLTTTKITIELLLFILLPKVTSRRL